MGDAAPYGYGSLLKPRPVLSETFCPHDRSDFLGPGHAGEMVDLSSGIRALLLGFAWIKDLSLQPALHASALGDKSRRRGLALGRFEQLKRFFHLA